MPSFLQIPLVGAYHHPPAALIIPLLPTNTNLILNPNPDNPYDPNAVEVYFSISDTDFDITTINGDALLGMGFVYDDLERADKIMLGFLARQQSPEHPRSPVIGNTTALEFISTCEIHGSKWSAKLAFAPDGKPLVQITPQQPQV